MVLKGSMKDRKFRGGWYYPNEFWFSPAYQSIMPSAKNLLHCLVTELRWIRKRRKKQYTNNGEVSFTEVDFKKRFHCCSTTYLKARNQLIKVGFIKQTYRGGMGRGDMSRYGILVGTNLLGNQERWRRYPDENWAHEIPKPKKQLVGVKTQWKKGQSGRKTKATLQKYTLNGTIHPIKVDP